MRTLYPGVLGIACCAFVLNCSGQTVSKSAESINPNHETSFFVPASPADRNVNANELPDSPGFVLLAQEASGQSQSGQSTDKVSAPSNTQGADQKMQRPVGTAAAEAPKVTGITAAQPAGIAIAPAKQKRVRTIVLKVGAIVGAGAAVGTVIALTAATSSRPPGAH